MPIVGRMLCGSAARCERRLRWPVGQPGISATVMRTAFRARHVYADGRRSPAGKRRVSAAKAPSRVHSPVLGSSAGQTTALTPACFVSCPTAPARCARAKLVARASAPPPRPHRPPRMPRSPPWTSKGTSRGLSQDPSVDAPGWPRHMPPDGIPQGTLPPTSQTPPHASGCHGV